MPWVSKCYRRTGVLPDAHTADAETADLNERKKLGLIDELDLMHLEGEKHYY